MLHQAAVPRNAKPETMQVPAMSLSTSDVGGYQDGLLQQWAWLPGR
jgi:hypothetical protein